MSALGSASYRSLPFSERLYRLRTILHIGQPKTGSTALQTCLKASKAELAAAGVLYPDNPPGCGFNNHRLLIAGYTPFARLPRHIRRVPDYTRANIGEAYAAFRDHLAAQVARVGPEVVILSSESLFRTPGRRARASLRAALPPGTDAVDVAAYVRRPSEQYLSNLQQRLRNSWRIGPLWVPPMAGILAGYADLFGRDAVRPRLFAREALTAGDIVADFLAAWLPEAGLDAAALPRGTNDNPSVSAESMDLLRRYRLAFHARADNVIAPDSVQLVRALRRLEPEVGAGRPRLHAAVAERLDFLRRDPLVLRDAWGIEFPGLDYAGLARRGGWRLPGLARLDRREPELGEIVMIDRDRQRALLAGLRKSPWARKAPDRAAWAAALAGSLPRAAPAQTP